MSKRDSVFKTMVVDVEFENGEKRPYTFVTDWAKIRFAMDEQFNDTGCAADDSECLQDRIVELLKWNGAVGAILRRSFAGEESV